LRRYLNSNHAALLIFQTFIVYNGGAYYARFEISFTLHGKRVSHSTGNSNQKSNLRKFYNQTNFFLFFADNYAVTGARTIDIPYDATDITLQVDHAVFIGTLASFNT
jgi:hypothetical protein